MGENTIYTTDRISTLPDFIAHHILSYLLDDAKSRVRMSVLSKGWLALTATFPILYFRQDTFQVPLCSGYYDHEYIMEKFCKYVQYTVSRFCDQNISAHTLHISAKIINPEQLELLGRCIDLVLEKGLQMMYLHFQYNPLNPPIFCLPNTLLSASSLTSLTLHQCELPSSLMVGVVKFKSLRLLSLWYLPIDEGVIEYLTKGSPLLEEIYLVDCYGFKTFCVKRHQNLLKVEIYCDRKFLLERIDVEAPNLSYFLLASNKDKSPSIFLSSCKKLTTFCYRRSPLIRFSDFLSNFPFLENVALDLSSRVNNLKLSSNSLRKIRLQSGCDLDEIDFDAPNLHLFEYCGQINFHNFKPLSREDSSLSKGYMKCQTAEHFDILWFQKLRQFLDKNDIFKVLKLVIYRKLKDVEKLKVIQLPPRELEHLELIIPVGIRGVSVYATVLDAVLWCCRPRSLSLEVDQFAHPSDVIKYTYEKLLQQEDEGQININFVLLSSSEDKQHFTDLNPLLNALSLDDLSSKITFIKEEAVQEAG